MTWDADGGHQRGYRLQVLGGWNLSSDGRPCTVPLRSRRLVALLAVAGPAPRLVLCGRLWPESSEQHALDSLRVTIHHVGRDLPGLLAVDGSMVALSGTVSVDLAEERATLADAGPAPTPFGPEPELLPGWYEDWVLVAQDLLRTQRIHHHASQAQRLLDAGDMRGAADAAGRSLGLDPLDEWSLEVLVRAHLGRGAACGARRALTAFRRDLQREFGQYASPLLDELDRLVECPPVVAAPASGIRADAPG